jgi:RNA polymerase sigma factor (sigma-70 family)
MDDRGHRARFEEIYHAYSSLILRYARRRSPDDESAHDVVAETFTTAWRRIEDVLPGDQARPWLYGVARRVLANQQRGDQRRLALARRLAVQPRPDVDPPVPTDDRQVARAFAALSDGDRELLTLVGWDGLDRDDIAAMLGCSRSTVRVRLHRARQRFARELAAAGVTRPAASGHETGRWAIARPDPEEA